VSPRQLNQRDNVDRTGYYKSAISNDNANTTIPCWPSIRAGIDPANVARPRNRVREIGGGISRRPGHAARRIEDH